MTDATYIEQAADWSKELTRMRARGPGDTENAMRAIEREYGVDYWTLWRLRYRRASVRDIGVSIYMRLREAYQAECSRQIRKLRHEITTTEEIAGTHNAVVGAVRARLGAALEETDGSGE